MSQTAVAAARPLSAKQLEARIAAALKRVATARGEYDAARAALASLREQRKALKAK